MAYITISVINCRNIPSGNKKTYTNSSKFIPVLLKDLRSAQVLLPNMCYYIWVIAKYLLDYCPTKNQQSLNIEQQVETILGFFSYTCLTTALCNFLLVCYANESSCVLIKLYFKDIQ